MSILFVFLSGLAGFFVFDMYRVYVQSTRDGDGSLTFGKLKGMTAHLVVYFAAGLLGMFVNLDVVLSIFAAPDGSQGSVVAPLVAAMLRSFSLGILGPAGLSKRPNEARYHPPEIEEGTAEDTQVREATFLDYIKYLLMR